MLALFQNETVRHTGILSRDADEHQMRDLNRMNRAGQSLVEPVTGAETTMLVVYTEPDVVR